MQRRLRVLFAKGLGKPIGHLSSFKQLRIQACHGGVKGKNLVKGPNNFIIECKEHQTPFIHQAVEVLNETKIKWNLSNDR